MLALSTLFALCLASFPSGKRLLITVDRLPIQIVDTRIASALATRAWIGFRWRDRTGIVVLVHSRIPSRNASGSR